jgi:hypothetical protein
MNFFGLNQAPLNGSVSSVVLAGVFVAAASFASAAPTVITPGNQITIAVSAQVQATGLRMVFGDGQAVSSSQGSASWALVTLASATGKGTSSGYAQWVAAYSGAFATASATGTITRLANALGSASSSGTASGDLTHRPPVFIPLTAITTADPSVKRAGATVTERDGYAMVYATATVTAAAEKQTLGIAKGAAYSDSWALGTRVHGGAARIECSMLITAIAASDYVFTRSESRAFATPTTLAMCQANIAASAEVTAAGMASRGGAAQIGIGSGGYANGQIAIQGASFVVAKQGAGSAAARAVAQGTGTAILPAQSAVLFTSAATADGARYQFGAGTTRVTWSVRATGISNPAVPAPADRAMRVAADDRSMSVPADDRTMKVNA